MFSPMEIAAVVGVAILVFGADKLPKLAKSAGQAKKEFLIGQAEADVAAEKARDEARKQATINVEGAAPAPEAQPASTVPNSSTPPHTS
jgi:sec-independent protein translocase protein TatA